MVNVRGCDFPPPGPGFVTVTFALPALAISCAVICAVTFDGLTKAVLRAESFQLTTELGRKLAPFTVSVKDGPPLG